MKFATETEQKVAAKPLKLGLNYGGVVESRKLKANCIITQQILSPSSKRSLLFPTVGGCIKCHGKVSTMRKRFTVHWKNV